MVTHVLWFSDAGASKIHAAPGTTPQQAPEGGYRLACGIRAPTADALRKRCFGTAYLNWTGRPLTCRGCIEAQYRPAPEPLGRLEQVGWARISEYSGDPLGMPRLHLTRDGRRTCCGRLIPDMRRHTRDWRYEEYDTDTSERCCRTCFTEERQDELREQDRAWR